MLVATSAFAFSSCAQFQGEQGDKGDKGAQGQQGAAGQAGVGIAGVAYDADGNLVVTFTDGTSQTLEAPAASHEHNYGAWTGYGNGMSFRVCSGCNAAEWKIGEEQSGSDADTPSTDDSADRPSTDDSADRPSTDDSADRPSTDDSAERP